MPSIEGSSASPRVTSRVSAPTSIPFLGLRATPVASYFSALAVLKIASDHWPTSQACWQGDHLVLHGPFSHGELIDRIVTGYSPTPVASPWNAGSGFYNEDQTPILTIETSNDSRLQAYRDMLTVIRRHISVDPPSGTAKTQLLKALHQDYAPEARFWLDATVDLTRDPPHYSSLLFTGGNDGKLDFARNTLEAVVELLLNKQHQESARLLEALLDERDDVALPSQSLGAYDPSTVKGLDDTIIPRSNPWAQVLLVEGLLALRGIAQRKPHLATGQASLISNETTKKDLWLPSWQQPVTLHQLRRNPKLITGHWRHATLPRNGRAHFIVPIAYRPRQGAFEPQRIHASRPQLDPQGITHAHDGSDEFELALCLAGLGAGIDIHPNLHLPPQLGHLKGTHGMTRLLRARVQAASKINKLPNRVGIRRFNDPFWSARPASPRLIANYLNGSIDTNRLHRLLRALCPHPVTPNSQEQPIALLPYPYRLLKLAFHQYDNDRRPAPLEVLTSLAQDDLDKALDQAHRFLLRRHPKLRKPDQTRVPPNKNLANSLLLPISNDTYQAFQESLS